MVLAIQTFDENSSLAACAPVLWRPGINNAASTQGMDGERGRQADHRLYVATRWVSRLAAQRRADSDVAWTQSLHSSYSRRRQHAASLPDHERRSAAGCRPVHLPSDVLRPPPYQRQQAWRSVRLHSTPLNITHRPVDFVAEFNAASLASGYGRRRKGGKDRGKK